jgi:hypothetical protein
MLKSQRHNHMTNGEAGRSIVRRLRSSISCSGSTITYPPTAQGAAGKIFFPRPLQCHLYSLHRPFLLVSRASLARPLLQPCTYHGLHLGLLDHLWRTSSSDTVAFTGLLTGKFSNSVTHSFVLHFVSILMIDHFLHRGGIFGLQVSTCCTILHAEIGPNPSVGFMLKRLLASVLKAFLMILDKVFLFARKKVVPLHPYDKRTKAITLPKEVERQLRRLVAEGNKVEAVRQVTRLTGAGLRVSKDYVDSLAGKDCGRTNKRHRDA